MGFDLKTLRDVVERHEKVVRVVIAELAGSSPREVGAAMLVWPDGQSGTIGGGGLEFDAARAARAQLRAGAPSRLTQHALGPDLGQCCGGRVKLLSELYDVTRISNLSTDIVARPVGVENLETPLSVKRLLAKARGQGRRPDPLLIDGWMIEPVWRPTRRIWIWGAGHVGRALVDVMVPLPDTEITWIDTAMTRFPTQIPETLTPIAQTHPTDLVRHAPSDAEHYVLTYSHALDLELCHGLLNRGFRFAGLIGSKTKWARFRSRLRALGHSEDQIRHITCPIGDPALGKHPQQTAIGVAQDFIARLPSGETQMEHRA